MRKKLITLIVSVVIVVILLPTMAFAYEPSVSTNEQPVINDYQEIVPFNSFYHTVFLQGWLTPAAVPNAVLVTVNRGGRVYQGPLTRQGVPVIDTFDRWGGVFSGMVHFTGIIQRSYNDIEGTMFELYAVDAETICEPISTAIIDYMNFEEVLASQQPVAESESHEAYEYQNVVPFNSFYHTIFLQGWTDSWLVPQSQVVNVTRNGRLYRGTLTRNGDPIRDAHYRWGAIFSGMVHFTGIIQRSYNDIEGTMFELCTVETETICEPISTIVILYNY